MFEEVRLFARRVFSLRALWILAGLQLAGNLASIPLLQVTGRPIGSWPQWAFWTLLSLPLIAAGLWLGGRSGLGALWLDGRLQRGETAGWLKRVLAMSTLLAVAGSVPLLLVNMHAQPERVPASWRLLLASFDAGVQEEVFYRLFLMSLLVWLGGLLKRNAVGRPGRGAYWIGIVMSGLLFGWPHIDDALAPSGMTGMVLDHFLLNSLFGVGLGWLYWKQGLESAMLGHFLIDAVGVSIVVPSFLAGGLLRQFGVAAGLLIASGLAVRTLRSCGNDAAASRATGGERAPGSCS